jgi:hypothetical protein
MANPNLQLLTDAARLLEPILGELVFVGGCATALLITDNAAADVRPTFDVDAIAEITSYAAYAEFSDRLRKLGFREDASESAPVCRWRQKTTTLDVMPLDETILGFSNTWYRPAMDHAEERNLEKGLKIRLVAPIYFCASKPEAFAGRGKNDFHASRDLEDLIAVVDGRAELAGGIRSAAGDVRSYLAKEIKKLTSSREFNDALPGHLPPDAASETSRGVSYCGSATVWKTYTSPDLMRTHLRRSREGSHVRSYLDNKSVFRWSRNWAARDLQIAFLQ